MPRISVLMPVFNAEKYLRQAIDSILGQTMQDFELLILNDGSSDSSKAIILSYTDARLKYIENESNKGLAFSRNRLIATANTDYLAWLDADDLAHPTRLEAGFTFLEKHPKYAMVGSWARLIDENNKPSGKYLKSYIPDKYLGTLLLFVNYFVQSGVVLRKSMLPTLHYDLAYPPTEDYELWVRIAAKDKVAILPKILVDYRIHGTNISNTQSEKAKQTVQKNHRKQLESMGIMPTESELNLHYSIAFEQANAIEFLEKTEKWLQNIKIHNKREPKAMNYILAHRWLRVCVSNPNLGIRAVLVYLKSDFRKINMKNLVILGQYLVKTLNNR